MSLSTREKLLHALASSAHFQAMLLPSRQRCQLFPASKLRIATSAGILILHPAKHPAGYVLGWSAGSPGNEVAEAGRAAHVVASRLYNLEHGRLILVPLEPR